MKTTWLSRIIIMCGCWSATSHAENLMDVFKDACANDAAYQSAVATFKAVGEDVPIKFANFLPQISVTGATERSRNHDLGGANIFYSKDVFYSDSATYGVNLNQSIFNYANWASLANAQATVKQQGALLNAAYQDLIIRTSRAYFDVLKASELLRLSTGEKKSVARQLEQNRERYKVGLIAITAVYESQASYDTAVAEEIQAQFEFASRLEELREITGVRYSSLMGLQGKIPLNPPKPANMQEWVCAAQNQNYTLQAARFAVEAARDNIKLAFSGHLPVVNGVAGYSYDYESNPIGKNLYARNKVLIGGVNLALPVYSGGGVLASTRQAQDIYLQVSDDCVRTLRNVISTTVKSYLAVVAGISRIEADRFTIDSRENALLATQAAYDVGTRTMVDVLDALYRMYLSQQIYISDQYNFLLSNLLLEQSAGTLGPQDLEMTNQLLTKRVRMIQYAEVGKAERISGPRPADIKTTDFSDDLITPNQNGVSQDTVKKQSKPASTNSK